MPSFKANLEELLQDQRALLIKVEANQKLLEQVSERFQKTCNDRLQEFKVKSIVSLGVWEPKVFVYAYFDGKNSFTKVSGHWLWYQGYIGGDQIYPHKILKGLEPPFDPAALERACAELAEDFGVSVLISEGKLVAKPENLRTTDDLLASLPGSDLIAEGKIWHMGWDVSDYWAILRDGAVDLHIFYSTNGHGFGYDTHLKPGESRKGFLKYIDADGISVEMPKDIRTLLESK